MSNDSINKDQIKELRQQERIARRKYRHQVRHRRQVILGLLAGVVVLLSGSFLIGKLGRSSSAMTDLSAKATTVQIIAESEEVSSEAEEVSIDYLTGEEMRTRSEKPNTEKVQREGYGEVLDTFLQVNTDTTLYTRDSVKSNPVLSLPRGLYVETYGKEGDWTKVMSKGHVGYVRNRDLDFIEDSTLFKVVDGRLIVNAVYRLDEDYETVFQEDAAAGLRVMLEAMKREGLTVEVAATYRNAQEEERERVLQGNPELAPEPGHAVFQTGYGVQFYAPNTDPRLDNDFETTEQFAWLSEHAPDYGFILRYPKGSESITGYRADPTIFYYVGVEDASIISNEGLTMEVFYGVN